MTHLLTSSFETQVTTRSQAKDKGPWSILWSQLSLDPQQLLASRVCSIWLTSNCDETQPISRRRLANELEFHEMGTNGKSSCWDMASWSSHLDTGQPMRSQRTGAVGGSENTTILADMIRLLAPMGLFPQFHSTSSQHQLIWSFYLGAWMSTQHLAQVFRMPPQHVADATGLWDRFSLAWPNKQSESSVIEKKRSWIPWQTLFDIKFLLMILRVLLIIGE